MSSWIQVEYGDQQVMYQAYAYYTHRDYGGSEVMSWSGLAMNPVVVDYFRVLLF